MTRTSPRGRPATARAVHAGAALVLLAAALGLARSHPGPVHVVLALAAVVLAVGSIWRATRPDPGLADGLGLLGGGLLAAATVANAAHAGGWAQALYAGSVLAWVASRGAAAPPPVPRARRLAP